MSAANLKDALTVVSTVTPRALTKAGETGFLVSVRGEFAHVYSHAADMMARAVVPVFDATDGNFVVPRSTVRTLLRLPRGDVHLMALHENGIHRLLFRASGASSDAPTLSPMLIADLHFDAALGAAILEKRVPSGILKKALDLATPVVARTSDQRAQPERMVVQMFDTSMPGWAPGNGHLFAFDGTNGFHFACDAFKDAGFALERRRMTSVKRFLATCSGEITLRSGLQWAFLVADNGNAVGWTRDAATHPKFIYLRARDTCVLTFPTSVLRTALLYVSAGMGDWPVRYHIVFSAEDGTVQLEAEDGDRARARSPAIPVLHVSARDFRFRIPLGIFTEILGNVRSHEVELRVFIIPPRGRNPQEGALFRVIEDLWMDPSGRVVADGKLTDGPSGAHRCRLTWFTTSLYDRPTTIVVSSAAPK